MENIRSIFCDYRKLSKQDTTNNEHGCKGGSKWCDHSDNSILTILADTKQCKCMHGNASFTLTINLNCDSNIHCKE